MIKFQRPTPARSMKIIQERETTYVTLEAVSALDRGDIGCIGKGENGWTFSPSVHTARSYTPQDLRDIAAILEKRNEAAAAAAVTDY